jgi:hypothetical protein
MGAGHDSYTLGKKAFSLTAHFVGHNYRGVSSKNNMKNTVIPMSKVIEAILNGLATEWRHYLDIRTLPN